MLQGNPHAPLAINLVLLSQLDKIVKTVSDVVHSIAEPEKQTALNFGNKTGNVCYVKLTSVDTA